MTKSGAKPPRFDGAAVFREVLYAALGEPIGLVLDSGNNSASVRAQLYAQRKVLTDPALECLQIRQAPAGLPPPAGDLVIIKVKRSNGDAQGES